MRLAVTMLLLAASAANARAQTFGTAYQNPWSSWDAYSYKRIESQVRARTQAAVKPDGGGAGAKARAHPLSATDFKRTGRGRPVLDQYIASTRLAANEAAQLRSAIESVLGQIEANARKDNVATSMAVLIVASTLVVRGVEIDDATEARLIASLNDVLAGDPGFGKLAARDKQHISDTMMVQSAVIVVLAASGDASTKAAAKTAARDALRFLTGSDTGVVP